MVPWYSTNTPQLKDAGLHHAIGRYLLKQAKVSCRFSVVTKTVQFEPAAVAFEKALSLAASQVITSITLDRNYLG